MQLPRLIASATGLAALAAAPLDDVSLTFSPVAGSSYSTAIRARVDQDGGELSVLMDGREVPGEFLPDVLVLRQDLIAVELSETILDGGESGPLDWLRRYDVVSWTSEGSVTVGSEASEEVYPWSAAAETRIEGRKFRFQTEDGEDYSRTVADGGREVSGLGDLDARIGLSRLLPDEEVVVGDSWTVQGPVLSALFDPGGDFGWELPPEAAAILLPDYSSINFSGELKLLLLEVEESATGTLAHCSVMGELVRTTVHATDLELVPVTDGTATETTEMRWEFEGEMSWNLDHARLATLTIAGDTETTAHTVRDPEQAGGTYESTHVVPGTRALEVRCAELEVDVR